MSALSIPCSLPATLIVLPLEIIDEKDRLIELAATINVSTPEELRAADTIQKAMVLLYKTVNEKRLEIGRQLDAVRGAVKSAADEALESLRLMQEGLGGRIKAYTDAEQARYQEQKRAAEAEAARLQAEEDRRAQEAAEFAAEPGQPLAEVVAPEALPVRVAAAYIPPPPKSSSVRKAPPELVIDEKLLPLEINGIRLWKEPNRQAIKALIAAGVKVPGADMVESDGFATKGTK